MYTIIRATLRSLRSVIAVAPWHLGCPSKCRARSAAPPVARQSPPVNQVGSQG